MRILPHAFIAFGFASLSAGAPAFAATADDPCSISKSMVGAAIGLPIVRTSAQTTHGLNSCSFHAARLLHYATISASRQDSVDAAKSLYHEEVSGAVAMGIGKAVPETGFGDEAAEIDGLLYVRKGTAIYHFSVVDGTPQPQPLAKTLAIARAVMPGVKP